MSQASDSKHVNGTLGHFVGGEGSLNFSLRSSVVFIGAVALNYMTSRWAARPRMLLLGLNRVVQLGWYCSTVPLTLALVPSVLHYRRPLRLQDKARVAEMLGEGYRGVD
ncbi:hypothetical protein TRAPUB_5969 [Trametes pubescens]|uniref:Uncharacterized protein n=1 Tax=Trametes pubescens TaxID=154538 RepID=A0A1M2W712_TRAPU|nr:hypothetical protein TRAPUB_5969 [Trametes pubescens]